jgi:hypothetical protein
VRSACALLFAVACSRVEVDAVPPAPVDARTAIVAYGEGTALEVHAIELGGAAARLELDLEEHPVREITALFYRETLAELAIEAGPIARASAGDRARDIPDATAGAFMATLEGDALGDWRALETLAGPLAEFQLLDTRPDLCAEVLVTSDEHAVGSTFFSVATISSTLAYSVWEPSDVEPSVLVRITRDAALEELPLPAQPRQVATDHRGTIYVSLVGRSVLQLDHSLRELARTQLPFTAPASLAITPDGTAFAYGGTAIVELVRGSTETLPGPAPLPEGTRRVFAVARDRMIAVVLGEIWFYGGAEWSREYRGELVEDDAAAFGDETRLLVATSNFNLLERGESAGTWREITVPLSTFALTAGVAFGGGRYLAVGTGGVAYLNTGDRFCPNIITGVLRTFGAVDATPDARTALAVSRKRVEGQSGISVWFDLPVLP